MLEDLNESRIARELDVGPLVTVVDAPKFTRLRQMLGEFYEEQVENADVLVLNKIDLATPGELDEAKAAVREINPDAALLFAEQGDTDLALLLDGPESELLAQMKTEADGHPHHHGHDEGHGHDHKHDDRHDHHGDGHDHDHHGHAHAAAESFVMDASGDFSRAGLVDAFASLPANVWRSKGFLTVDGEPSLLQFTMGQIEIDAAPARERPYLVVIGEDLDRPAVESGLLAARHP